MRLLNLKPTLFSEDNLELLIDAFFILQSAYITLDLFLNICILFRFVSVNQ